MIIGDDMKKTLGIRHSIIGEIYRAGKSSVKLESVRDTAKRFGVAQCTVSAVMKELIRENWLFSRPGVGVFTNPGKFAGDAAGEMAGVIHGDGRLYYYNRPMFDTFTALGHALLNAGMNFRNIQLDGESSADVRQEIESARLTALIWMTDFVQLPETYRRLPAELADENWRVIGDTKDFERINVVAHDTAPLFRAWDRFFAQRPANILCYLPPWHTAHFPQGPTVEFLPAGAPFPIPGTFDIIVTDEAHFERFTGLAPEVYRWNEDVAAGLLLTPNREAHAAALVARLQEINDGDHSVRKIHIPMKKEKIQ